MEIKEDQRNSLLDSGIQELIKKIASSGELSEKGRQIIRQHVYVSTLKKNEYFVEAGKHTNQIAFVIKGALRLYFLDQKGKNYTRFFFKENHFVGCCSAFMKESVSNESIVALSTCRLLVLTREATRIFAEQIPVWPKVIQATLQAAMAKKAEMQKALVSEDATTRYLHFLKEHPDLIKLMPLGDIASYLNVTQSSLSRIRKTLSVDKR